MLVISAPDERQLLSLLDRVNVALFQPLLPAAALMAPASPPVPGEPALPLAGRKLHVHTEWGREQRRCGTAPDRSPPLTGVR